jgi:hypothetical protein
MRECGIATNVLSSLFGACIVSYSVPGALCWCFWLFFQFVDFIICYTTFQAYHHITPHIQCRHDSHESHIAPTWSSSQWSWDDSIKVIDIFYKSTMLSNIDIRIIDISFGINCLTKGGEWLLLFY